MEDKIIALEKRIEELERQQSEHLKQQDIFPGTIKTRHLDDDVLSSYLTSTSTLNAALLNISGQAIGDLLYASSTSVFSRLAIGAAGTFLMGGTTPSYGFAFSKYKFQAHNRAMTAASGDVSYTGYGFTPKVLILFGSTTGSINPIFTFGVTDSTSQRCISCDDTGKMSFTGDLFVAWDTYPTKNQGAVLKTMDSDGFTLTWTKASTPSAYTFDFGAIALG